MTKKHFIALANTFKARKIQIDSEYSRSPLYHSTAIRVWEQIVANMAVFCKLQNSQFNRERWMGYILGENGPNGGKL